MGRQSKLDWQLERAAEHGNTRFIETVRTLRQQLFLAMLTQDWPTYNEVRLALNERGAEIPVRPYTEPNTQEEQLQMGMFDKPQYLTGDNGFVQAGDTFYLHNARLEGTTRVNGNDRDQAKLLVSHERDGEKVIVYTTGTGIVNQVKRMDAADREAMPIELRLDQVPSGKGNPTNVMTPADQPAPSGGGDFASATGSGGVTDF